VPALPIKRAVEIVKEDEAMLRAIRTADEDMAESPTREHVRPTMAALEGQP
jgi:DNA-binding GntR family transcriptional regulator